MSVRVAWKYNKDGKISTRFNEVEHLIKEMIENIGKIRQNWETNSTAVKEQKRIIEIKIHELKKKNQHTGCRKILWRNWKKQKKQVTEHSREVLLSFDEKQIKLTQHQTNIVNIEKYASDLQTFVAANQIEKKAETQYTCLQSLTKLWYNIYTGLKTIITSIQTFGEVVVESISCEVIFVRKKG